MNVRPCLVGLLGLRLLLPITVAYSRKELFWFSRQKKMNWERGGANGATISSFTGSNSSSVVLQCSIVHEATGAAGSCAKYMARESQLHHSGGVWQGSSEGARAVLLEYSVFHWKKTPIKCLVGLLRKSWSQSWRGALPNRPSSWAERALHETHFFSCH